MLLFIHFKVPLGVQAGKYLMRSQHVLLPGIDWKLLQEEGLVFMREATYDEATLFLEENEGGKNAMIYLGNV